MLLHSTGENLCYIFIMDRNRINSDYKGKIQVGHEVNQISYIRFWSNFIYIKAHVFDFVPVFSLPVC